VTPAEPLRLAVYSPGPARPLTRGLGAAVRTRPVHRPEDVRASDDLVLVTADADAFVRRLTAALGPHTPPVLVVARHTDERMVEKMILAVAGHPATPATPPAPGPAALAHAEPLTPRERDVMTLLATGRTIREIADALAIGGKTVRNNLSNIYRKLGVRRQAEALIRWFSLIEAQPGT
jgi:DNA-binding CsgD family transcriptional regulator